MKPRVRIAPSPTGYFHFGLARTALYNYLFAKKTGGEFILRLEDTDKARSTKEFEEDIYSCFDWLGLSFDEKYVQSQHAARHAELLKKLVDADTAYISKEPRKDDPDAMVEVVRLRNPGKTITFNDVIRGDISFDTTELKDFVIARSIDDPLYHFAVVADDGDARITHVIRGEDHISNTPRQILIQEALGLPRPIYAHLPLILAPDRTKMSKRKHQTAMREFRAQGYLPEAMINFTALLGWNPKTDEEILTLDQLIEKFALEDIHKSGAVFDVEKLQWFNRQYLMMQDEATYGEAALSRLKGAQEARNAGFDASIASKLTPILRERVSVWSDIDTQSAAGEYDYYFAKPTLEKAKIPDKKSVHEDASRHLEFAAGILNEMPEEFSADELKARLWPYAEAEGKGAVLWPLRYSLSGKDRSPDPFTLAAIFGKTETHSRIEAARTVLSGV